ncbi:hypothetical protein PSTT_02582 [Puccinia striiformis]|uniref:GPI ethanolamine phosphate transferase 2 C-terminal domain-containing protein n=1 Tax=Puccinia striiformis TaxID=27350 RepID=A0A2S4VZS4_9BASI|nr:hypothetical protein PSTT_02582 [Puccinia striiformis]
MNFLFLILHLAGCYIFALGFLLSRINLSNKSTTTTTAQGTHSKAIIVLIDALRFDFLLSNSTQLSLPKTLTSLNPSNSVLYHFVADPPTTTLQRLKGLTTGTLPTFIDLGSNFATDNIRLVEDHWLSTNKSIGFVGDDTWLKLFGLTTDTDPGVFDPNITYPYPSFNVEDLDTVDNGVREHFYDILETKNGQWDILIGHFLGLDHAGHRYGPSHASIPSKLEEYNTFLTTIVDRFLDDDTLLIVMGDHGMDPKGDHGGDSFLEVSSGLWIYSKSKPLVETPIPEWLLPDKDDYIDLDGIGTVRSIPQIDLVPTLSLLLGIPIPFSNLGMIIPELFYRKTGNLTPIESLSLATSLNSQQLHQFINTYSKSTSDLNPFLSTLDLLYTQAIQESSNPQLAYRSHRQFGKFLLVNCRKIWAKFVPNLMVIGIIIIGLSFLSTLKSIQYIQYHQSLMRAGLSGEVIGLIVGSGLSYSGVPISPDLTAIPTILTSTSIGSCLAILIHKPTTSIPILIIPDIKTIITLLPVLLHGLCLASNSYTVWEDRSILHLISYSILIPILLNSFQITQKRARNRLVMFSLIFALTVRLVSFSRVCREEQALALPIIPAWFLGFSDSYRGPASFFFGTIFRVILLSAVQYWITDYLLASNPSIDSFIQISGTTIKLIAARFSIFTSLFSLLLLWYILPLCIDVSKVKEEEHKEEGQKPKLLVVGFANSFGSSYLMFLVSAFGILFLVNQPVGQIVLSLSLISILSLVEINDTLNDLSPNESKVNVKVIIGLHFLGYLVFFGTGHQATFATIQWKTGFIGLSQASHFWSPILIFLNTFSGFILVGLSVPLFVFWNKSPSINLHRQSPSKDKDKPTRSYELLDFQLKFIAIQTFICLLNMIFIYYLRRHLMVWKIFSPRFFLSSSVLVLFDGLFCAVGLFSVPLTKFKVNRTFGYQGLF